MINLLLMSLLLGEPMIKPDMIESLVQPVLAQMEQEAKRLAEEEKEEAFVLPPEALDPTLGVTWYQGHYETYYNLPMDQVVRNMADRGTEYENPEITVREDGMKLFNGLIMVAADTNRLPYGTLVETSRGPGIVVDHCASAASVDYIWYDLAVTW